jgi:hypothetical protein
MSVEKHLCKNSYIYYVRIKPGENKQLLIRIGSNPLNKIVTAFFSSLSKTKNFVSPNGYPKWKQIKDLETILHRQTIS